jgi:hypothetical protein
VGACALQSQKRAPALSFGMSVCVRDVFQFPKLTHARKPILENRRLRDESGFCIKNVVPAAIALWSDTPRQRAGLIF